MLLRQRAPKATRPNGGEFVGTVRRGKSQKEDSELVKFLRNDLSRVCELGSLVVPELFRIDTYPTVHQMVSRIRAKLGNAVTVGEIFSALFPCGSITGAPKLRAMQILHALEGTPRGVYCGSIGFIAPSGAARFSVAIRTVTLHDGGEAVFNVGGGIVSDSTARSEYDECLLKARFATGMKPDDR